MARGRRVGQRDVSTSSLEDLLSDNGGLDVIQDRRLFHFEGGHAPPLSTFSVPVSTGFVGEFRSDPLRTKALMENPSLQKQAVPRLSNAVHFDSPNTAIQCVRRRVRREVMFALRKRRKGSGARRRRRNYWSNFHC